MLGVLSLFLVFSSTAVACQGVQEWPLDLSDPIVFEANKDDCYAKTIDYFSKEAACEKILLAAKEKNLWEAEGLIKNAGCAFERSPAGNDNLGSVIYVVNVSNLSGRGFYEFLRDLRDSKVVSYFEPRYFGSRFTTTPNDCYISGTNVAYWYEKTNLRKAWDISTGHTSVKVGLIDTGINGEHQDFWANANSSLSKTFSDGLASTTEERLDPLQDQIGHGSLTGGIIAGYGNNNVAKAGVAWHANLVSLKLNTISGLETPDTVAAALNYANEKGIKIVNFSGGFFDSEPQVLINAINNFDGLLVVSAGNIEGSYSPDAGTRVFPAFYSGGNFSNVISVGASNSLDQIADYSWVGQDCVNIFAPGDAIYGPNKYSVTGTTNGDGTSFSAPFVAGVAALMQSVNPTLTPAEIKSKILLNGQTVSAFVGQCSTGAKLDAYRALLSAIPSKSVLQPSFSCTRPIGGFEDHHWYKLSVPYPGTYTVSSTGNLSLDGELYADIQSAPLKTAAAGTGASGGVTANFSMNYHFSTPGTYYLHVKRNGGYSGHYSISSNFVAGS